MTDRPYEERLGGSYVREAGEGEPRLVERTAEPAPAAAPAAPAAPAEPAKKTKRSD